MKRILLPLFFLITYVNVHCQVKEITIKNNDLKITEQLSVLKSDKKIRQGSYEKYLFLKRLNKNTVIEKGQYENNKKVGIWTYYDIKGNVSLQYCFDNDSILICKDLPIDEQNKNRPLLYLGSMDEIRHICNWGIRIPIEAHKLGESGKVIITINLSENGDVTEYVVKQGINKVLNNEALRVVKLLPQSWLPVTINGERIKSSYNVPIKFVLLGVINRI